MIYLATAFLAALASGLYIFWAVTEYLRCYEEE